MTKIEHHDKPVNVAGMAIFEIESLSVMEWHPQPDGEGPPTQVHVLIQLERETTPMAMRFKGPATLDAFIMALSEHRESVFGKVTSQ